MINTLVYIVGALVCFVVLTWFIFELLISFVATVSYVRFLLSVAKVHNKPLYWQHFIGDFIIQWWQFRGYRPRKVSYSSILGEWNGIGDWRVYRP